MDDMAAIGDEAQGLPSCAVGVTYKKHLLHYRHYLCMLHHIVACNIITHKADEVRVRQYLPY